MKKFFKIALVTFLSASIFFGCSYLYLQKSFENARKPAENKQENVPYYEAPENCGLRFFLPGNKEILIFLDFTEEMSYIINIDKYNGSKYGYAGYSFDYELNLDYSVLSEIFDRLGGIDLKSDGTEFRFTGVQVCDKLCTDNSDEFSYEVIRAVCKRIAENGLSDDDFVFLLQNADTKLTMPLCIYWRSYIKKMFANAVFVNWVI